MLSETLFVYIILFQILEFYEIRWQKAQTMMGMLARMYQHYHKNIFLFFLMHPTFYLCIFFMIASDYNFYAISIFFVKALDISVKVVLIKQVFIDKTISHDLSLALLAPLPKLLPYVGLVLYPVLIFLSFSS